MIYDLRTHLKALEDHGLLRRVHREVDKNWELSAIMRWVYMGNEEAKRYAVLFERVKGYDIPVVVGAIGASYKTYAVALGIDPGKPRAEVMWEIRQRFIHALKNPLPPVRVSKGVCKEKIDRGSAVNIHKFPIPVWTPEKDRGWEEGLGFITAPYCMTKDPETGIRNVGTYRMMVRPEPNVVGIGATQGAHIMHHTRKNEERGQATEIATVIGGDPVIGMISPTEVPYGVDELAVAGALRGSPIEVVRCETVDIEVPAHAEFVIEGRLPPKSERPYEPEAPFGEYTGYQGSAKFSPVYEIGCITYRNDCIYQAFMSQMAPSESSKLRHIAFESLILKHLQDLGYEGIVDINIPESAQVGVIIVSIRKLDDGYPGRIAQAIFSLLQPRWGKFIIVTDDDVDIYDLDNVLWAVTFRTSLSPVQRNIHFLEGMVAQLLDYSAGKAIEDLRERWDLPSSGVLIDATRPYVPYPVVSLPPARYLTKALESWREYGLPELERKDLPRSIIVEEEYLKKGLAALPRTLPLSSKQ
ncbi:MAG: UbiD family decarboxylase [Deltaproteobacteria bacterium]|nr:UbiD family decarboxylase [Deltaproteobacteria bacterium]